MKAIAKDLGYSYGHVSRCKTEAIRRLREIGEGEVMRLLPEWYIIEDEKRSRGKNTKT